MGDNGGGGGDDRRALWGHNVLALVGAAARPQFAVIVQHVYRPEEYRHRGVLHCYRAKRINFLL